MRATSEDELYASKFQKGNPHDRLRRMQAIKARITAITIATALSPAISAMKSTFAEDSVASDGEMGEARKQKEGEKSEQERKASDRKSGFDFNPKEK
jgi:hypothetical protein